MKKVRNKSAVAKDLRSPKYRCRVERKRKGKGSYSRKHAMTIHSII